MNNLTSMHSNIHFLRFRLIINIRKNPNLKKYEISLQLVET